MTKEEFEKVFAETAEKSGVAEMARDYQLAENLEVMMIELRDKLCASEQPSEDLKKEIDRFQKAKYGGDVISVASIACHFANWQKEQIMKSAFDAVIVNDEMSGCVVDCEQGCLVLEPHTYAIGQQLKILIIKVNEK